ncbi:MAG: hypothetical protein IJN54_09480 [Lachnospiraceae bacterium]|nr:hypothetical protein [Lachnospiraceae bacterium]
MSAKTKIVVLHLKELIYTGIFAVLGILFIILLVVMFLPKDKESKKEETSSSTAVTYEPGTYSTSLSLNGSNVSIEVDVAETEITDLRIVNLDEAITTMYPLVEPSFDDLTKQILDVQNLDEITYSDENRYTYMVLLDAVESALEQAKLTGTDTEINSKIHTENQTAVEATVETETTSNDK